MRVLALIALVGIMLTGAAFATTNYTLTLWPYPGYPTVSQMGDNYFALPGVPLDPDPASVFDGVPIGSADATLMRFDAVYQTPVPYDEFDPDSFGNCLLGDGYIVSVMPNTGDPNGEWIISYEGVDDGVPGDPDGPGPLGEQMTDMWVSLHGGAGAMHWVGHPFNHDVWWEDVQVTNGEETRYIMDAVGEWIEGYWQTWDPITAAPVTIDPFDDGNMHPGSMYLVPTLVPNIALIIPAN